MILNRGNTNCGIARAKPKPLLSPEWCTAPSSPFGIGTNTTGTTSSCRSPGYSAFVPSEPTRTVFQWKILASTTLLKTSNNTDVQQQQRKKHRSLRCFSPHSLMFLFMTVMVVGLTLTNVMRSLDHRRFLYNGSTGRPGWHKTNTNDRSSSSYLSENDSFFSIQPSSFFFPWSCAGSSSRPPYASFDSDRGTTTGISRDEDSDTNPKISSPATNDKFCVAFDFYMKPLLGIFIGDTAQTSATDEDTRIRIRPIVETSNDPVSINGKIDEDQIIVSMISSNSSRSTTKDNNNVNKYDYNSYMNYSRPVLRSKKRAQNQLQQRESVEKTLEKKRAKLLVQPNDYIYQAGGDWDGSPIVLEEFKLIFFTSAKVGCSVWKSLFRRMMHYEDWQVIGGPTMIPWNPTTNGLKYLYNYTTEEASRMLTAKGWTRAIFVRDPKERFVSAFLDKIVRHETFVFGTCCIPTYKNETENTTTTSSMTSLDTKSDDMTTQYSSFHQYIANETAEQRYARQKKELLNKMNWKNDLAVDVPVMDDGDFRQQLENETPQQRYMRQKKELMKHYNPSTILLRSGNKVGNSASQVDPTSSKGDIGNANNKRSRKDLVIDDWCTNFQDIVKARQSPKIFLNRIIPICDNAHWRPQSRRMEDKYWPYINFVGHMETVAIDAERLLRKVGAWKLYGSNGWSHDTDTNTSILPNGGSDAIFAPQQSMGRTHATNAVEKLQKTIDTVSLERMIEEYYAADYAHPVLNFTLKHIYSDDAENGENNSQLEQAQQFEAAMESAVQESVNEGSEAHEQVTESANVLLSADIPAAEAL